MTFRDKEMLLFLSLKGSIWMVFFSNFSTDLLILSSHKASWLDLPSHFPDFCFYSQPVLSCVKHSLFSTNVKLLLKSQGINVFSKT